MVVSKITSGHMDDSLFFLKFYVGPKINDDESSCFYLVIYQV